MQLLLATTPIILILIGIVVLKKPAWIVSLIALAYTVALAMLAFGEGIDMAGIFATSKKGVISALQTMFLVWSAFSLLELMITSGSMDKIKVTIGSFTNDRRVQVILIAFCFGTFIEGVTGAGAPAALLAPFLLGLGFPALTAAAACLIANGMSPSFGGAGVPTIIGMGGITGEPYNIPLQDIVAMTGRFHLVAAIAIPIVVLIVIFGRKSLKGMWGFLLVVGISMAISMFLVSNYMGPEFSSFLTGIVGTIVAIVYLRTAKVAPNPEFANDVDLTLKSNVSTLKAFMPYILVSIMLPVVRFSVPLQYLLKVGYATWIGMVIHVCVFVSSIVLGCTNKYLGCIFKALKKIAFAAIAMCALLAMSNTMNYSGMMKLIAQSMANVAGQFYPFVAVLIGSLGAFITGSNLGSNSLFAPMHVDAGMMLKINPVILAAANNGGGALGNMICTNNIIAVNATLDLKNSEGAVLGRTIKAWLLLAVIYGGLALLYAHVMFPDFRWVW